MTYNPNMPYGSNGQSSGVGSWFTPTGGYTPQVTYAGSPYGSQPGGATSSGMTWYPSQEYGELPSASFPTNWTADDIQRWIKAADAKAATLTEQWKQSSGIQRRQIEAQIQNLQDGQKNAMELARLHDQTARYGTDVASRDRMAELMQRQNEFQASHGLEIAKAYTQYASTPDDLFQLQDLKGAIGAASSGGYQSSLQQQGAPHAKTMDDFSVLSQYGGSGGGGGQSGGGSVDRHGNPKGGGGGTDQRITAANAVMKALPPSATLGHDQQDYGAIDAIKSLYFGARPGQVEQLDPIQQREAMSGLRRSGYNAEQVDAQRRRSLPGQQSSMAA